MMGSEDSSHQGGGGDGGIRLRTRRTRFVCISDTHNCTVKLPKGDVLIHCGDLTNMGSFTEVGLPMSGSQLLAEGETDVFAAP